ncbi:hypothetical protein [Limobrevibacterium gyesilva]|uniref:Uncharacterized protein n=1 Tax=Limobrevibacterium gyesilva TaxID=2991712 RepID=A0AA42CEF1_9PROT|nr:hypothetical protein [Limobrevibacterium gyesilva]MCW3473446.1 hypothetical protein [Limobrevibacterium gyesilva]
MTEPPSPRVCAVCGTPARPPFRAPPPELAPDLDLRPGEPTRSTLGRWIATCRGCGAAAPDLAALPVEAAAIVRSDAYQAVRATPAAALAFLRWAMLCPPAQRAEALLQAAWAADDAGDDAAARSFRADAAACWGEPASLESALRLVDVLRRADDLVAADARAAGLEAAAPDENSARIVGFQRTLIAAGDTGRHLISSALRPPARMPHVAHGRREPKPGPGRFWKRLFGG